MSQLDDLYQEIILDHTKRPRNFGPMADADRKAEGYNPLCGDRVTVYLKLDGDRIRDIKFQGAGCAISTSSASLLTESVKGKTTAEAEVLFERFHKLVTGKSDPDEDPDSYGKLAVFSGVSEYPARVKCASLCWHTLHSALGGSAEPVTTE